MPDVQKLMPLAIAAAALYAAYKFAPNAAVKTAVLGVAGVLAARQMPYLKEFV
jgi:hypothetical protein